MRLSRGFFRSRLAEAFLLAAILPAIVTDQYYVSGGMYQMTAAGVSEYRDLVRDRMGTVVAMRHWESAGGLVIREVSETFDSAGGLSGRRVVVNVHGRGAAPIGRVVRVDTGDVVQFFVKNHLGSTVRVVGVDGSTTNLPAFDYQPYGEPQVLRDDSLHPAGPRYTGKELDTEVDLYYFGARWYDPQLAMWIGPDPAGEFRNPYSYLGYSPLMGIDPDGLLCLDVWNRSCRRENTRQFLNAGIELYEAGAAAGDWVYDNRDWIAAATYFAVTGDAIGAFGLYQGLAIADAKGYGLTDWQTYAYAAGGYAFSTMAMKGGIIAGGLAGSTTIGLVASSTLNSVGTYALTGGRSDVSTSFGAFSVNWSQGEVGYFGKRGNSLMDNLGYVTGGVGNASDAFKGARALLGHGPVPEKTHAPSSNFFGDNFTGPSNADPSTPPANARDLNSWRHDRAFDKLGIRGGTGLVSDIRAAKYDGKFVRDQLMTAFSGRDPVLKQTPTLGFRAQTVVAAAGLGVLAAPKIFAGQNNVAY